MTKPIGNRIRSEIEKYTSNGKEMRIQPRIDTTPIGPAMLIKEPQAKVDLSRELPRILRNNGWPLFTEFRLAFTNHEMTKVLQWGRFVVVGVDAELKTTETDDYRVHTASVAMYQYQQIGAFYVAEHETPETAEFPSEGRERRISMGRVKWNPGKQMHEVWAGEDVVFRTREKPLAEKVARGEEPVPESDVPTG